MLRILCLVVLLLTSACTSLPASLHDAPLNCSTQHITRMFFGTQSPNGVVTRVQWAEFLNTEITPRFPNGLTVFDARGQWRGAQGAIAREDSFVVEVAHAQQPLYIQHIVAIVAAYKTQFAQEAVMVTQHAAQVCF
jgi:hypothetical protein